MKASVCLIPGLHVARLLTGKVCRLRRIENGPGEMGRSMTQRQHFQRGPHFGDLFHFVEAEAGNPYTPARLADDQPLGFQPSKRLAHRHMAGAEFIGNMILPEPCTGSDHAGDDSLGKFSTDTGGDCI